MMAAPLAKQFNRGPSRAPSAALAALLIGALALCACSSGAGGRSRGAEQAPITPGPIAGSRTPSPFDQRTRPSPIPQRDAATPGHLQGRNDIMRAALLLPFSHASPQVRAEAASMLDAAQLALFETAADTLVLIPKDTEGTPDSARAVARDALAEGADVILGPFFSAAVPPVAEEAARQNVPVIAFSNDRSAAGAGAYLIDIPLEQEIGRMLTFAAREISAMKAEEQFLAPPGGGFDFSAQNPYAALPTTPDAVRFAVIAPDNPYGRRVRDAVEAGAPEVGAFLTAYEFFLPTADAGTLTPIVRRMARFDERQAVLNANPEALFDLPYDAIILPEGGVRLLSLAPLLPYYDVDPRQVQFMGTSLWNDVEVAREPALSGGWFPAPDPDARALFAQRYRASFGAEPSRLAGLSYDAVALVGQLTAGAGARGLTQENIQRPQGFRGAEGLFRFLPDGTSERALAILEVQDGRFVVIDPAPANFLTY